MEYCLIKVKLRELYAEFNFWYELLSKTECNSDNQTFHYPLLPPEVPPLDLCWRLPKHKWEEATQNALHICKFSPPHTSLITFLVLTNKSFHLQPRLKTVIDVVTRTAAASDSFLHLCNVCDSRKHPNKPIKTHKKHEFWYFVHFGKGAFLKSDVEPLGDAFFYRSCSFL